MSYEWFTLLSFSIVLPVIAGCIRFPRMDTIFYPIFFLLIIGLLHEAISYFMIRFYNNNQIIYSVYTLIDLNLVLLQLYLWRNKKLSRYFIIPMIAVTMIWLIINLRPFPDQPYYNVFFNIIYSAVVIILSIHQVNKLAVEISGTFLKNSVILFCTGFIIFYIFSVIVEVFWLFGIMGNTEFAARVSDIIAVVNLFTNIIFTVALLWTPNKQRFMLQS